MRWTYENSTTALFGLCVGLWIASWMAFISPAVPFFFAYPVGAWVIWRVSQISGHKSRAATALRQIGSTEKREG